MPRKKKASERNYINLIGCLSAWFFTLAGAGMVFRVIQNREAYYPWIVRVPVGAVAFVSFVLAMLFLSRSSEHLHDDDEDY